MEKLLERNIVIEITDLSAIIREPSRGEGLGESYAFQPLVYYYALEQ